jgi:hypothetical protein
MLSVPANHVYESTHQTYPYLTSERALWYVSYTNGSYASWSTMLIFHREEQK